MNKIQSLLFILFFCCITPLVGQNHRMYGFTDADTNKHTQFVAFDYTTMQYDTLISFNRKVNPFMFNSAIDEYNGRYFFLGNYSSYGNTLFTINLKDLTIDSVNLHLGTEIEYDPLSNSIISIIRNNKKNYVIRFNLYTQKLDTICEASKYGTILGTIRALNYLDQKYLYAAHNNNNYYYFVVDLINKEVDSIRIHKTILNHVSIAHYVIYDVNHNRIVGSLSNKLMIYQNDSLRTTNIPTYPFTISRLNDQQGFFDPIKDLYYRPFYRDSLQQNFLDVINIDSSKIIDSIPFKPLNNGEWSYNFRPPIHQKNDTIGTIYGANYQWYFNNNPIVASNSQKIKAKSSGNYSVAVENLNGDTVLSTKYYFSMLTNTPKQNANLSELLVYPNPFHEYCNFDLTTYNNQLLSLQVFNSNGQLIRSFTIRNQSNFKLNKSHLKEGIYYYRLISKNKVDSGKLVVY